MLLGEDLQFELSDGRRALLRASELRVINKEDCAARVIFFAEGYSTAADAEQTGAMLSVGLVWAAISKKFSLLLNYQTALPAEVYDLSGGLNLGVEGTGFTHWRLEPHEFRALVQPVFETWAGLPDHVRLSMELFGAAPFETTSRARFVSAVSALEPLPKPNQYDAATQAVVDGYLALLDARKARNGIPDYAERSHRGRLNHLRAESIAQSLKRLTSDLLPGDQKAADTIEDAYTVRSNILHTGAAYPDLDHRIHSVEKVVRRLYAATTGWPIVTA